MTYSVSGSYGRRCAATLALPITVTLIGVPPSLHLSLPLPAVSSGCLHHPNANAHFLLLLLPPRKLSRVLAARRLHLGRFWHIQFIYACMYRINILFDSGGLRGFRTAKLVLKGNAMYSACVYVHYVRTPNHGIIDFPERTRRTVDTSL